MTGVSVRLPEAVLFDLDGTLLDTAPDLVHACNIAAQQAGLEPQPLEALKPLVSQGAVGMLEFTISRSAVTPDFELLLEHMLNLYQENIAVRTRLFEGMAEVLNELESRGMPWGIVTNKVSRFTDPLLQQLSLLGRAACVISGDTYAEKKPHPLPMREACRLMEKRPQECVYIGDARRDIDAGRNAGMMTLAALYGYVPEDDPAEAWGAHALLQRPTDLLSWMDDLT